MLKRLSSRPSRAESTRQLAWSSAGGQAGWHANPAATAVAAPSSSFLPPGPGLRRWTGACGAVQPGRWPAQAAKLGGVPRMWLLCPVAAFVRRLTEQHAQMPSNPAASEQRIAATYHAIDTWRRAVIRSGDMQHCGPSCLRCRGCICSECDGRGLSTCDSIGRQVATVAAADAIVRHCIAAGCPAALACAVQDGNLHSLSAAPLFCNLIIRLSSCSSCAGWLFPHGSHRSANLLAAHVWTNCVRGL